LGHRIPGCPATVGAKLGVRREEWKKGRREEGRKGGVRREEGGVEESNR
jgi:hypothetical protein